jgi:hypothetical protein
MLFVVLHSSPKNLEVSIMRFLSPASVLRLILSFRSVSKDIFDDYFRKYLILVKMGGASILFLSPPLYGSGALSIYPTLLLLTPFEQHLNRTVSLASCSL